MESAILQLRAEQRVGEVPLEPGADWQPGQPVPQALAAEFTAHVLANRIQAGESYPALNHHFIAGTGQSSPAEYQRPGHVAVEVVDDLAKWVLTH